MEYALIHVANVVTFGSHLAQDHSGGDFTLYVEDAKDFDDDGGSVVVGGITYGYSARDMDTNTLALDVALIGAVEDGEPVTIAPLTVEKRALVMFEDAEDAVTAIVPHALFDLVPEGIRAETEREAVTLELENGTWVVQDVIGRTPLSDGAYLEPGTVPGTGPDGLPPAAVATPEASGGVNAVYLRWTAVNSADPVKYEVHVSTLDGFTAGPSTLERTTDGSTAVVTRLPDGTPLAYGTTYHFQVLAYDEDGYAPASPQVTGAPLQITSGDVAAEFVYAGQLAANQITSGSLTSDIVLAATIRTAEEGARVEMGAAGITVYDSDGVTPLVAMPTDPAQPNVFVGQITANTLTTYDNFQMRGANNSMLPGTTLTLHAAAVTPMQAPTFTSTWSAITADSGLSPVWSAGTFGLHFDGTTYRTMNRSTLKTTNNYFGATVVSFNTAGTVIGYQSLGGDSASNFCPYGLTKIGTSWYVLGSTKLTGFQVRVYDASWAQTAVWAYAPGWTGWSTLPGEPAIGTDGTNVWIARASNVGTVRVTKYTPAGAFVGETVTDINVGGSPTFHMRSINVGNFDYGAAAWVLSTSAGNHVTNTVGTSTALRNFIPPAGTTVSGVVWDGSAFITYGSDKLITHTSLGNDVQLNWHAKMTWYQTTGNYESSMTPQADFTVIRRSRLTLASPSDIPDSGNPGDPNSVRFYVSMQSTPTTYYRQTDPGVGVAAKTFTSNPVASGSTGTSGVAFPPATAAKITSNNAELEISSDGTIIVGSTEDATTTAGNKPALRVGDIAGIHLRIDGNEIVAMSNNTTLNTLYLNQTGRAYFGPQTWQTGTVVVPGVTGGGTNSVNVTFGTAFQGTPQVMLQSLSGIGATTTMNYWPTSISTTGFTANVARSTAADTTIRWLAVDV